MGRIVAAQMDELPTLEAFYTLFTFTGGSFESTTQCARPAGRPDHQKQ